MSSTVFLGACALQFKLHVLANSLHPRALFSCEGGPSGWEVSPRLLVRVERPEALDRGSSGVHVLCSENRGPFFRSRIFDASLHKFPDRFGHLFVRDLFGGIGPVTFWSCGNQLEVFRGR